MSVINATIGAGTRRMLQDVLAWNHARSGDINRVNAMAAAGLVPKDANGNLQLPQELLEGLWRPFPGSSSNVNVTNIGNGQPADGVGQQAVAPPAAMPATSPAPQPPIASSPTTAMAGPAAAIGSVSPPSSGTSPAAPSGILSLLGKAAPWLKLIAAASGLGGAGLLGAWLNAPKPTPAPNIPKAAQELMYELHLGSPQKSTSGENNG